ncbi:head GIN domain-containing protein [Thermophagus xiamenensis]|uniref:Putative auto-transporter adhesin, head GIN domain n=1 Tax=Thermophagus xiamenensis TaxID=385682 RepID=A0A1I2BV38_9BACT|nr:head GIN domain-containing protein [Thermophagus xiamenensis]SFE59855.1 Putative auto-transporter adhesin, head GIN domain [Thermophagus xiamenensis]
MKRIFVSLLSISFGLFLFAQEGQENMNKETRIIKDFNKLKVTKGINVTLIKGDEPKAEINIVNAPTSDVIIENDQNELTVKMRTKVYQDVKVQVYLTYTDIRSISVGSGGNVDNEGVLTAKLLTLDAGLDGVINLNVEVDALEATVSASRIALEGYSKTIEVKASTGGKFQGERLEAEKAYIAANTGGIVSVNVSGLLDAKASTGATVEYTGNPQKLNIKETLGGKVEKI